jgi:hypothetical protein
MVSHLIANGCFAACSLTASLAGFASLTGPLKPNFDWSHCLPLTRTLRGAHSARRCVTNPGAAHDLPQRPVADRQRTGERTSADRRHEQVRRQSHSYNSTGKLYRNLSNRLLSWYGQNDTEQRRGICIHAGSRVAYYIRKSQAEASTAGGTERFHLFSDRSDSAIGKGRSGDGVEPCQGRGDASSVDERGCFSVRTYGFCCGSRRPERRAKNAHFPDKILQEVDRGRTRRSSGLADASHPAEALSTRTEAGVFSHTSACTTH